MTDKEVDQALAVARETLAAPVPAGLVERSVRAALAAPPAPRGAWWRAALPTAWRAAVCVNVVAAAIVIWVVTRPTPPPVAHASPVDQMFADVASAELARALRLPDRSTP